MKKDDLINAMGSLPDDVLEQTEALRRKNRRKQPWLRVTAIAACAALVIGLGWQALKPREKAPLPMEETEASESTAESSVDSALPPFPQAYSVRPQLLDFSAANVDAAVTPSVPAYDVTEGLGNVVNLDQFYLTEEKLQGLEENLFAVSGSYVSEFFELYEFNCYAQIPNYVTVDSLMHTYHLYFSLLLNRTEKEYLAAQLRELSNAMLQASLEQYENLQGTDWEEAACRNVAYFAVAEALQNPSLELPACAASLAGQELALIDEASGIAQSPVAENLMDYSQFKPRGYYEGDEVLERYFRAMMWYGQVNFAQNNDSLNRSALLMTVAMADGDLGLWEKIYTVTSFFSGVSDDLGYYEYAQAVSEAYGGCPKDMELLVSDENAYETYVQKIAQLPPPAINSVPVSRYEEGELNELNKGFRFMGQRFTIDAAVMQQLVYRAVEGTNGEGAYRMLPDVLDFPAALGSETALRLLREQGETAYGGYTENMTELRDALENTTEASWTTSLYSTWIHTLRPLLTEKGEGWPSYMTGTAWANKSLETFAGSYTELKHDTVLYAKQMIAEMGGGPIEEIDDRGYVEPEAEVYRRFMLLAKQTAEGLSELGMLSEADREHLGRLEMLAQRLLVIAKKELNNEVLTDAEYDLIRDYGGTLEHFWLEATKSRTGEEYLAPRENPASLVTDIATDPNGTVLQIGTGRPAEILAVVPVDGTLRLVSGAVYDFYQFEQPISQRLTDTQWRQMIGEWAGEDGWFQKDASPDKPWWTDEYWCGK